MEHQTEVGTMNRNSIAQFTQAHPGLVCWLLVLLGIGLTVYEWHAVRYEHFYNPIAAVLGPLCAIFFAALATVPSGARKTSSSQEKTKRVLAAAALFGLIAGSFNWYAMTHW